MSPSVSISKQISILMVKRKHNITSKCRNHKLSGQLRNCNRAKNMSCNRIIRNCSWIKSSVRAFRDPNLAIRRLSSSLAKEQKKGKDEDLKSHVFPETLPNKIHAAVLQKFSEPLVIENVDPPKIVDSNQVLVKVHYCALNGSDILSMENAYSSKPTLPFIPGYEVVGEILETGEKAKEAGYKVGNKIVALNKDKFGGFSEQCVAEVSDIWKVPSTIKSIEAVCLLENYMTALIGLEKLGSLEEEDIALINVGFGNTGLAAVDIASNVFRAKVIAVCGSEDRAALVREKGAFAAFKHSDKKLIKKIKEIAAEKDIKDIFGDKSGEKFKELLNCFTDVYKSPSLSRETMLRDDNFGVVVQYLSREGRIVIAGYAAGQDDQEDDKDSFRIEGIKLKKYRKKEFEVYRQTGEEVLQYFEEGLLSPTRACVSGLWRINEAIQLMSDMKSFGKVIIDIRNKDAETKIKS